MNLAPGSNMTWKLQQSGPWSSGTLLTAVVRQAAAGFIMFGH